MNKLSRARTFLREHTTLAFRILLPVAVLALLLRMCTELLPSLAQGVVDTASFAVRRTLAALTGWFPLSLGEWILYLLPTALVAVVLYAVLRARTSRALCRLISGVLALVCLLVAMHSLTLGVCYQATTLDERLGFTREDVSAEELRRTALYLSAEANALVDGVTFDEQGSSVMPYSLDELCDRLNAAYATVDERLGIQGFPTRIKAVTSSRFLSYVHILGIYSFYTGEANLNVDYPDYNFPFTSAHEFAHQRGIAREGEANFLAHLVCIASDDVYIRYSGYTNLLIYVLNAYYRAASGEEYSSLLRQIDPRIRGEYAAESRHGEQYDTAVGDLSSDLNDLYLKANGTEGSISYGFVVDMAVAYYKDKT